MRYHCAIPAYGTDYSNSISPCQSFYDNATYNRFVSF